ncbi:MAG: hypothetical protein KBT88_08550 [Gammaproteobacteria bacterium]|nr:hypothetical protein [Gammaproteobacteria bacterium]MBQ0839823.1 hypothetical protein [Gammaproteobacteria bacterium]
MKKRLSLLMALALSFAAQAQTPVVADQQLAAIESQVALVRQVAGTKRAALVAENMNFTSAEAEAFWPLYREYRAEVNKVGDGTFSLIKDFAKNYSAMTDEKAIEITDAKLKLDDKRLKIKKSYVKKFRKAVAPAKVFRVFQIENRINAVYTLKLASEIPLMK